MNKITLISLCLIVSISLIDASTTGCHIKCFFECMFKPKPCKTADCPCPSETEAGNSTIVEATDNSTATPMTTTSDSIVTQALDAIASLATTSAPGETNTTRKQSVLISKLIDSVISVANSTTTVSPVDSSIAPVTINSTQESLITNGTDLITDATTEIVTSSTEATTVSAKSTDATVNKTTDVNNQTQQITTESDIESINTTVASSTVVSTDSVTTEISTINQNETESVVSGVTESVTVMTIENGSAVVNNTDENGQFTNETVSQATTESLMVTSGNETIKPSDSINVTETTVNAQNITTPQGTIDSNQNSTQSGLAVDYTVTSDSVDSTTITPINPGPDEPKSPELMATTTQESLINIETTTSPNDEIEIVTLAN